MIRYQTGLPIIHDLRSSAAHTLKSTSVSVGALGMTALCHEMQMARLAEEDGHHCNVGGEHVAIDQCYFPWRIRAAILSPIINTVGLIGARTRLGIIEASTTRNPSRPYTLPY